MKITIKGQDIILDKERAIYLPQEKLLAIADLHLGKAAHFRKAGLAIPNTVSKKDLSRLKQLVEIYQPKTLLINGDMFHSDYNDEITEFGKWRKELGQLEIVLVKGNHDRQRKQVYEDLAISVIEPCLELAHFTFLHDATDCKTDKYAIGGHIHPGISVYNNTKQRLKFPCFYFGNSHAILPAFSNFTGLQMIKPDVAAQVFAITPNKVVQL